MSAISLNSSMRTNLLSLQQISKLQDQTQLRLSTGLKVNSALDNPSSFYTSQSLNNRANDLSSLLDAMGQGIETIKAANEGISKAEDLLEQMKAIAEQVQLQISDIEEIPDKATMEAKVGANGAVVSTAQELRDAINSGKETICVYGAIDLGNISASGSLDLQANQKLVGVNYFGNYGTKGQEFSSITATSSGSINLINIAQAGCLVSDLSLECTSTAASYAINANNMATLQNLDINLSTKGGAAIVGSANIEKNLNIKTSGNNIIGIGSFGVNINSGAIVNIETSGNNAHGIVCVMGEVNIAKDSIVNIKTSGQYAYGIVEDVAIGITIAGNVSIETTGGHAINCSYMDVTLLSTAQLYIKNTDMKAYLSIEKGAKLAIERNGATTWCEIQKDSVSSGAEIISIDDIITKFNGAPTSAWKTAGEIIEEMANEAAIDEESLAYQNQYNSALSQFDMLINDSSYKSINLLKQDSLKVDFNEDKSANLVIEGVNVTSAKIGLTQANWQTQTALQESLNQVIAAKEKLRDASSQLGNYYSILTNREDFTERLINVLEEGADKLTLADMNEESANMLALQTRQQLALTSLSLASQASQSVLNLF